MTDLLSLIRQRDVLLADGATGTNLFDQGLGPGDPPELWNIDQPQKIEALIRSFVDAGSDLVLSNTFGANRCRLKLHKAEDQVFALNKAAAELARRAASHAGREIIIAGSMGPTGELMQPLGELTPDECADVFREQAQGLKAGGVDVLWLETLSAQDELQAAVEGAASVGLPVCFTLSFDTNGGTMMGIGPGQLHDLAEALPVKPTGFGTNCGVGAAEVVAAILLARRNNPDAILVAKANCGIPKFVDGAIRYDGTPELMARYAVLVRDCGASIIGGCCGTTPDHLKSMREALDTIPRGDAPTLEQIEAEIGPVSAGLKAMLTGESPQGGRPPKRRRRG
ncbi:betaine--homocysteine S-methyltransferase [Gammaproteobacteria bacterium]|nr:betaine--homocysteine S-methyltransferase [Gammaproteobacteria bacterium]